MLVTKAAWAHRLCRRTEPALPPVATACSRVAIVMCAAVLAARVWPTWAPPANHRPWPPCSRASCAFNASRACSPNSLASKFSEQEERRGKDTSKLQHHQLVACLFVSCHVCLLSVLAAFLSVLAFFWLHITKKEEREATTPIYFQRC